MQSGIHDRFLAVLTETIKTIRVDQGLQEQFVVGPLINRAGIDKVASLVADTVADGGRVMLGGERHDRGELFYQPTILADLHDGMRIASTEIFGPVFAVYRFEDENEVVTRANDSEYGLVAYAYTRDLARAFRLSRAIEAGMVIMNSGSVGTASVPFGGVKHSGYGREGSYYGIEEYVEVKYILMGGLDK